MYRQARVNRRFELFPGAPRRRQKEHKRAHFSPRAREGHESRAKGLRQSRRNRLALWLEAYARRAVSASAQFAWGLRPSNAYNATNWLNRTIPDTDLTTSTFGQTSRQPGGITGRQVEFGMKFLF